MPIKKDSSISEDRLVIAIEGISLKKNLPEIRGGLRLPFYFQILDYEPNPLNAWKLRQRNIVELVFSEDANTCTLPKDCLDSELDDNRGDTFSLIAGASLSLLSIVLF